MEFTTIKTIHGERRCALPPAHATYWTNAETLLRETPSYYYTVEHHTEQRAEYYIQCESYWTSYHYFKSGGRDGHPYDSKEEAEKAIPLTATCWGWSKEHCKIVEKFKTVDIAKYHRWKKG